MGGIVELREVVREYVTFTNWDVLQGLGAVHPGATNQWPQTSLFSQVLLLPGDEPSGLDTGFTEATTQTAPPFVANVDMDRCTTPPFGMEGENQYQLVVTTSIEQLSLGPSGNNPEKSPTDLPRGNTFQNPWMAAVLSGSTRAVGYGGANMKEWGGEWTWYNKQPDNCLWVVRWTDYCFWVGKWINDCLWADRSANDCLWAEGLGHHWVVTILIAVFNCTLLGLLVIRNKQIPCFYMIHPI